jgi:hypothetical protein
MSESAGRTSFLYPPIEPKVEMEFKTTGDRAQINRDVVIASSAVEISSQSSAVALVTGFEFGLTAFW